MRETFSGQDTQYNLGTLYENGLGVKQDNAEAVKWFPKAAEQGDANAQFNLAVLYHNGQGVKQNYAEVRISVLPENGRHQVAPVLFVPHVAY